ncbi:Phenylalanyl-tRNA synthetase beta-chain [Candidatus Phytoplasma australiense]|uniref:Phenylalanine--tRNA ligase beta subunit n=1 Tax=Phytoplasma australiense TaxID=59748 RepID=B1VA92_PHYAS|nr:Phenylalanyl-tRNA synthetase beta-chain [Candidatus Phytoplasma australiense]
MKILEPILKKHFSNLPKTNKLFDLINNYINEVETLRPISQNTNLVVGKILEYQKITGSQKLNLVTVDIGTRILKIVCGATNLDNNGKVIVALEGSFLEGFQTTLKNKKIYGVFSEGMLCALEELGIDSSILTSEEKTGIYFFQDTQDEIKLGSNALIPLGLAGFFLELGVTPNRADLLSYFGFAKDLAAVLKSISFSDNTFTDDCGDFSKDNQSLENVENFFATKKTSPLKVNLESNACLEYHACILENITIKPSPLWLRNTLLHSDIKPINNVVDVTNLIMLEYGIPLHAFDSSNIKEIKVRQALPQEKITTLNENAFELDSRDLVITDGTTPIALAGIIGLLESGIKNDPKNIILECAYFKPESISQTSQKLKIKTMSSLRFERGVNPELIPLALKKACELLIKLADATITYQPINKKSEVIKPKVIDLNLDDVKKKTGITFLLSQTKNWLLNLGYQILNVDGNNLKVIPPFRRYDIKIKENVIADLVRLYGCKNLLVNKKNQNKQIKMTLKQKNLRELKKILVNLGFYETVTYSLISQEMFECFNYQKEIIQILNPLSQDKVILRQSLLSGLIEVMSYQHKRKNFDNAFFEISKVYHPEKEKLSLGLILSGKILTGGWQKQDITSSFFVLKGVVEKISSFLGVDLTYQKSSSNLNLHPGIQAGILYQNEIIGKIGKIHPNLNEKHHLKDSFVCEILLSDQLLNKNYKIVYHPISKFPVVTRDLSFLIASQYAFLDVQKTIQKHSFLDLIDCQLFDVYQIDNDKKELSLAFRLSFSSPFNNLEKEIIDQRMNIIVDNLIQNYQIKIR